MKNKIKKKQLLPIFLSHSPIPIVFHTCRWMVGIFHSKIEKKVKITGIFPVGGGMAGGRLCTVK